jgi:enoyl-CoA hydratase
MRDPYEETQMPTAEHILYDQPEPTIARITLNRLKVHNAQDTRFLYELNAAFDRAAQDPEVKVIILAANGKHFSAGHDLSGIREREAVYKDYPQITTASRALQNAKGAEGRVAYEEESYLGFSERWRNIQKVTIAQVQGKCIAAGLMLAWPCDLIVASDDAQFSDVTVALGICGVEYFAHPWEFGVRKAKQMLYTGDPISAEEARQLGMVNEIYPRDQLADKTLELARRIARQPLFALKITKMACNAAEDQQGRQTAINHAFALHHLGHAHAMEVYGVAINPEGMHPTVRATSTLGKVAANK